KPKRMRSPRTSVTILARARRSWIACAFANSKVRKCPRVDPAATGVTNRASQSGLTLTRAISARNRSCSASTWSWIASTVSPIAFIQSNTAARRESPVGSKVAPMKRVAFLAEADVRAAAALKRAERGEPSGVARPHGKASRTMHEADAFARHRIFVAAGKIERAIGIPRQGGRQRHEAVIAVEDDQRL